MKKKKVRKFIFVCLTRGLIISLLVSLLVFVPTITTVYKTREEALSNKFFGKKAEYQGVITLWNVDTFEGGSASRKSLLEDVSLRFEKKNKGAYIKVENLSLNEFLSRIKEGKKPHLFSFGTGVASYLEENMVALSNDIAKDVKTNFYSSGLDGGNLKAAAWCYNIYTLISRKDRIEKAKKSYNQSLINLALELSFDKVYKKSTKHTYSLTFGGNDYVNAVNILPRVMEISVREQADKGNIDDRYKQNTFYEAYARFVGGKANMLLGTLRDVFRMENRKQSGKETDVIYEPLTNFTDLVSYISIIRSEEKIENVCKDFISFLISKEIQLKIANIGLFSTTLYDIYKDGTLSWIEKQINNEILVKNVFS